MPTTGTQVGQNRRTCAARSLLRSMERLHLTNTLTHAKAAFEPLNQPFVGVYVCGPTV
jgi:hypothetical protein